MPTLLKATKPTKRCRVRVTLDPAQRDALRKSGGPEALECQYGLRERWSRIDGRQVRARKLFCFRCWRGRVITREVTHDSAAP